MPPPFVTPFRFVRKLTPLHSVPHCVVILAESKKNPTSNSSFKMRFLFSFIQNSKFRIQHSFPLVTCHYSPTLALSSFFLSSLLTPNNYYTTNPRSVTLFANPKIVPSLRTAAYLSFPFCSGKNNNAAKKHW